MPTDLKIRFTPDNLLKVQGCPNVADLHHDSKFIYIELGKVTRHFLQTKQLTLTYIKKQILKP